MASRLSLYKWKRQESPDIFLSKRNVQEWVKQVQKASDEAARDIFGDQSQGILKKRNVFVDDEAISEAQDLLDSWIQKRNVEDLLVESDLGKGNWSDHEPNYLRHDAMIGSEHFSLGPGGSIHCEPWDSCYEDVDVGIQKTAILVNDDFDEEYAFQEVVHGMLGKDIVDTSSVNDNRFHTKTGTFKDPTPKMELRHQQVKEKAKERKAAWEKAKVMKMTREMVEHEARKQLRREEQELENKTKREEEEIRREMVKIRKALQEENALRTKQRTRQRQHEESAKRFVQQEVLKQQKQNEENLKKEYIAKEEMKRMLMRQIEEDETRKEKENLKLVHRYFSSWYGIIMNKRVKLGKAHALSDWRIKLRCWSAWRTYVLRSKSDREAQAVNQEMRERHRKEALADRFYRQLIFQRCLNAWVSWVSREKLDKQLKDQHHERTNKMADLLKAAASGQLWQTKADIDNNQDSDENYLAHSSEVEEISLRPFTRERETKYDVAMTNNGDIDGRRKRREWTENMKANVPRQAWPHKTLKDMKTLKPTKGPQPVATFKLETRREKDAPRATIRKEECPRQVESSRLKTPVRKPSPRDVSTETVGINSDRSVATKLNVSIGASDVPSTAYSMGRNGSVHENHPFPSSGTTSMSKQMPVTSRKPPTKPLHLAMEERAKARAERKSHLESKKRQAEEEKLARLKKEQELKEMEILAEKQAALRKKREEIKIAKQRELDKHKRLEEIKELNQKADEHYRRVLLRKYGLGPFKLLIDSMNEKIFHSENFYRNRLLKTCFREWVTHTKTEWKLRNDLADNLYKIILLRRQWRSWKKYRHHLAKMGTIAEQFSKRYLVRSYMRIWQNYVIEERLLYWDKENRADEHNDRRLKQKAMTYWKRYIPLLKEEEKREKRRNELRKHVRSLLPDFQGIKLNGSP